MQLSTTASTSTRATCESVTPATSLALLKVMSTATSGRQPLQAYLLKGDRVLGLKVCQIKTAPLWGKHVTDCLYARWP